MPTTYKIAIIPGDGIGIEVTQATVRVLEALQIKLKTFQLDIKQFDFGSARYLQTGSYTTPDWMENLKEYEAIFFGAVGHPDVLDHISLWQLILPMRQYFQQYVNVRPTTIFEGVKAPLTNATSSEDLDWVILRENTEGEYAGQGGRTHVGTMHEVATEVAIYTRVGIERFMRFSFDYASKRPKKQLTIVTKSNAQRHGMVLWDEVAESIRKEYPQVKMDKVLVDAMTVRMIEKPQSLDVIACTNLHGDVLSDMAAGLCGSIGLAPSSSLDPSRKNPSLFEPVHGAAFDIMGKDLANPVAAFLSAIEMLRWLNIHDAADLLDQVTKASMREGHTTRDLKGSLKTSQVTDWFCQRIQEG